MPADRQTCSVSAETNSTSAETCSTPAEICSEVGHAETIIPIEAGSTYIYGDNGIG